jgi:hypothetical protein
MATPVVATPAVPTPAAPPVAPLVHAPRTGSGRGHGRKLALLGGLAAVALVAFASTQFLGGRPTTATTTAAPEAPPAPPAVQPPPVVEPEVVAVAPAPPTAAELFPACDSAVAAGAWADAAAACERVRDLDGSYPGLGPALAASYVGLGKDRLAQGGPLPVALDYFHKALAAKSDDAEAEQQRLWAREYQAGEAALAAENWPAATQQLEQLYADAPDYLASAPDGGVRPKLYTAAAGWGDALLQAGEYTAARERCEQALAVQPDGAEANACQATAIAALAPPAATTASPPAAASTNARPTGPTTSAGSAGTTPPANRGTTSAPPPVVSKPPPPAAPQAPPARPSTGSSPSSGEKPIFIPQR